MWILFALGSLVFQGFETVIDKIAIVKDKNIDSLAASFWRVLMFLLWFVVLGLTGFLGVLRIILPWPVVVFALLWIGGALFYTYLLKNIEVTGSSALSYASPFVYLVIDTFLFKVNMTPFQILGIILLAAGGMAFVLEPGKLKIRREFTSKIWGIFLYNLVLGVAEYYGFKYFLNHASMNEVSFFASTWLLVTAGFMIIISVRKKWGITMETAQKNRFLGKVTISKGLDAACSWLWLHAISMTAVSRVDAVGSLYPLILIGAVYLIQNVFGLKAEEEFSKGYLALKLIGIALLSVGGFLAG